MAKRAILIILDSVGIGAFEDSYLYGDENCNTLKHIATAVGGLKMPNMQALGLGNLEDLLGVAVVPESQGAYGKMKERSKGKDTTTGHWEMMGIVLEQPFRTYPHGFPSDLIKEFEQRIGRKTLGNIVASGTEIIEILGEEHMRTGQPIVYTSADSVFQIAAHEEIIPLPELYKICEIARELLVGEHKIGRVIARPFIGKPGSFVRTPNRHDYAVEPPRNILDCITESSIKTVGVGKIKDVFDGRGIDETYHSDNNRDGMEKILTVMQNDFDGFVFANLVDFDQAYGHRNDSEGYARALEEFDQWIPKFQKLMSTDDILFISADHGCDPTTPGTDHTREQVPLLVYGDKIAPGTKIGVRSSFADLGQTIAEYLGVNCKGIPGQSFYKLIRRQ